MLGLQCQANKTNPLEEGPEGIPNRRLLDLTVIPKKCCSGNEDTAINLSSS